MLRRLCDERLAGGSSRSARRRAAAPSSSLAAWRRLRRGVEIQVREQPEVQPRAPRAADALARSSGTPSGSARSSVASRMSRQAMSASGARKCSQNWRYATHGAPSSCGSSDSESMRIGRPRAELDVVGGGVRSVQPASRACELDVEGQQRSVAELAERPLVGVRDELDGFGPDHRARVARRRKRQAGRDPRRSGDRQRQAWPPARSRRTPASRRTALDRPGGAARRRADRQTRPGPERSPDPDRRHRRRGIGAPTRRGGVSRQRGRHPDRRTSPCRAATRG